MQADFLQYVWSAGLCMPGRRRLHLYCCAAIVCNPQLRTWTQRLLLMSHTRTVLSAEAVKSMFPRTSTAQIISSWPCRQAGGPGGRGERPQRAKQHHALHAPFCCGSRVHALRQPCHRRPAPPPPSGLQLPSWQWPPPLTCRMLPARSSSHLKTGCTAGRGSGLGSSTLFACAQSCSGRASPGVGARRGLEDHTRGMPHVSLRRAAG